MFHQVLAASAHGGSALSPATLFLIAVVAAAFFWRPLLKVSAVVVIIGFLFLIVMGASAVLTGVHAAP